MGTCKIHNIFHSLCIISLFAFLSFASACTSDSSSGAPVGDTDADESEGTETDLAEIEDSEPVAESEEWEEQEAEEEETAPPAENLWTKVALELVDPIQQGNSVRTAIDGAVLAANTVGTEALTAFGWDEINANEPYVWHVDLTSGVHSRKFTVGEAFTYGENFCFDENWCQFLAYDPTRGEWLILGPQSSSLMGLKKEENGDWTSRLTAATGTRPSNSAIDYSFTTDWSNRRLYVYGYSVPTGAGSRLYGLEIDSGEWTLISENVPPAASNCLVAANDRLFSIGGQTDDPQGSEDLVASETLVVLDPANGSFESFSLPNALKLREKMSCAWDTSRELIFVFGGATVRDYWDESQNDYHNDLWSYDPETEIWAQWTSDFPGSSFLEPDENGDRAFEGNPEGPDFGKNRGTMAYDATHDRLILLGRVPRFTGEQVFFFDLSAF